MADDAKAKRQEMGERSQPDAPVSRPQHEMLDEAADKTTATTTTTTTTKEMKYYRVVYRGVVSLLQEPKTQSQRSGAYVSYGEIIGTMDESVVETEGQHGCGASVSAANTAANAGTHAAGRSASQPNVIPGSPQSPSRHRLGSAIRTPVLEHVMRTASTIEQHPPSSTSPQLPSPPRSAVSHSALSVASFRALRAYPNAPPQSSSSSPSLSVAISAASAGSYLSNAAMNTCKVLRVDVVLTGGYAMDGSNGAANGAANAAKQRPTTATDKTPKRTNHAPPRSLALPIVDPSPLPAMTSELSPSISKVTIHETDNESDDDGDVGDDAHANHHNRRSTRNHDHADVTEVESTITSSTIKTGEPSIPRSKEINGIGHTQQRQQQQSVTGSAEERDDISHHGYIFSRRHGVPILEPLPCAPFCETGQFWYRVVSPTPLAILTGPSLDAPKTKATILPGTVHEISLRVVMGSIGSSANANRGIAMEESNTVFLRLSRRRGWVVDRRIPNSASATNRNFRTVITMREVPNDAMTVTSATDESSSIVSMISGSAASIATPMSSARRRHRAPRRRQESMKEVDGLGPLPQLVGVSRMTDVSMLHNQSTLSSYSVSDTSPPMNKSHHTQTITANNNNNNQAHGNAHGHAHGPGGMLSPSSNISLLSDESCNDPAAHIQRIANSSGVATTPDRSVARSTVSNGSSAMLRRHQQQYQMQAQPSFFLMRVNAPRGLKILDAPHFQVNSLIRGSNPAGAGHLSPAHDSAAGSGAASSVSGLTSHSAAGSGAAAGASGVGNKSIFSTMAGGNHTTTLTSKMGNPAVFDSITKARKLPRGTVFEACKRMEAGGAAFINQGGSGLIKLSDNSGWAIVPYQHELDDQYRHYHGSVSNVREGEATRAFEEVGNAVINDRVMPVYLRVLAKGGVAISLPPHSHTFSDEETSPTSSTGGSSGISGGNSLSNSEVASSVGSSFLDAMFRTPQKKRDGESNAGSSIHLQGLQHGGGAGGTNKAASSAGGAVDSSRYPIRLPSALMQPSSDKMSYSTVIPCGMCLEVDPWVQNNAMREQQMMKLEYARLRGGQGWIPRQLNGRAVVETVQSPEFRLGSFWFRVQARSGIKVRMGPSNRAPSIKSDDGVFFRFECGEYLRASEVMTVFKSDAPSECFAKLYRNRHVRLHNVHSEYRSLTSLTTQAEWVQIFSEDELFLDECATEPRIERHRQGWRYNVVLDARIHVHKGPSLLADRTGMPLLGGESVLITERVTGPGDTMTWLRLKDSQGWIHNVSESGEPLMIPHSLRHRKQHPSGRSSHGAGGGASGPQEDIAYNTIIARLFHSDLPENGPKIGKA